MFSAADNVVTEERNSGPAKSDRTVVQHVYQPSS
jgi:hypothetical protein